jgi:hypothetical protein
MSDAPPPYRGRLAPSPTGYLHLGHARTFWIAQERAAAAGGALILRSEDLDRARCRTEFRAAMLEDLRWFGLRWSEGPDVGVHVVLWCDTATNLNRSFDRRSLREFGLRVVFQMSAEDSANLIDTVASPTPLVEAIARLYATTGHELEVRTFGQKSEGYISKADLDSLSKIDPQVQQILHHQSAQRSDSTASTSWSSASSSTRRPKNKPASLYRSSSQSIRTDLSL